jgi:hypothetical protein
MKRVNKSTWLTIALIAGILLIAYFSLNKNTQPQTDEEVIECIGKSATLYVQLGCTHCRTQEDLFRENIKHIEVIDCFYETDKCEGIQATPSWKIGNKKITGVQTIEQLKELTKC